jgi:hypothetical protein
VIADVDVPPAVIDSGFKGVALSVYIGVPVDPDDEPELQPARPIRSPLRQRNASQTNER